MAQSRRAILAAQEQHVDHRSRPRLLALPISRLNFRLNAAHARSSAAPRASFTSSALGDRFGNQTS